MKRLYDFVRFLIPRYEREGKTHLTLAIGCTGGRHRSVFIANTLAEMLAQDFVPRGTRLSVRHRDAEKG